LMLPPPMNHVIEVANKFLNQDIYQPHDTNLRGQSAKSWRRSRCTANSNEETSEDSSSESSSSSSKDESESSDKEEVAKLSPRARSGIVLLRKRMQQKDPKLRKKL